jgi:hypothetical protein
VLADKAFYATRLEVVVPSCFLSGTYLAHQGYNRTAKVVSFSPPLPQLIASKALAGNG